MSLRPTRDELNKLLWSDPASEAWEGDARSIFLQEASGGPAERTIELMEVVAAETSDVGLGLGGESDREDLRDLACGAKRCAILLLHAAWFAERAAKSARRDT